MSGPFLLLAGDGIKSAVRRAYLPEYELSMGRAFTMRGVFPTSRLEDMEDFPEDSAYVFSSPPVSLRTSSSTWLTGGVALRKRHWWGPDRAFFTSPLGAFTSLGKGTTPARGQVALTALNVLPY